MVFVVDFDMNAEVAPAVEMEAAVVVVTVVVVVVGSEQLG